MAGFKRWANEQSNELAGWYTGYCFDNAVIWFGRWVENKLHEYDEFTKKPKYTLTELLADKASADSDWRELPPLNAEQVNSLKQALGVMER